MGVTAPQGFRAAGIHCGIKTETKENQALDLALVESMQESAYSAAVFTSNKLAAAPVVVSKKHLVKSQGKTRAVIINSGCANAATGQAGETDARQTCEKTAQELNASTNEILVCSTGLIGYQLPVKKILQSIPELVASLSEEGASQAAKAIMTTDTKPKEHLEAGNGFLVGGMAKGAAMLAPDMATMLAVITTDAICESPEENLPKILKRAVDESFNSLSVDGVQSTNDTVILLANGLSGEKPVADIQKAVTKTCQNLAHMMAEDAEGATRTVGIHIFGAPDNDAGDIAARHLANSVLLKCSWYGGDPYWGRLASELGASGIAVDLSRLSLGYGRFTVFERGAESHFDKSQLAEYMSGRHLDVHVNLGLGNGEGYMLACDLGYGYIDENSKTS